MDCPKCKLLSEPGVEGKKVRLEFTEPTAKGRGRDVSKKRGCPLLDHAITTTGRSSELKQDCMSLFAAYDRDFPASEFSRPAGFPNSQPKRKKLMQGVELRPAAPASAIVGFKLEHISCDSTP